ncbi:MAG: hypothetical protein M1815_002854 [Lichina confinis]|nr:MAG: hypothetical protein M1815_002854 [Lichina confinis]
MAEPNHVDAVKDEHMSQVEPAEDELDASLDADIDMTGTQQPSSMNMDGAGEESGTAANLNPVEEVLDSKTPSKKDATLREFLGQMDDYAPIIPDAVTNYYLMKAGLPPPPQTPPRLARLLALATQKFIADIAADAYQYSRIRSSNTSSNNPMGGLGAAAAFPGAGQGAQGAAGAVGQPGKEGAQQHTKGGNVLGLQRPGYGGGGLGGVQGRTVLTMEDLGMAVGEYGANVQRGEFYR